jgi:prepilin-type N-terminal cleavage/methylation domain-containing protein
MRRGFSLVELILAVSLVGLIVVFLLGLLPSGAIMIRQAEQQISATGYAQEIMAHLCSVSFETLRDGAGTLTPENPGFLGDRLSSRKLSDSTVLNPTVELRTADPSDHLMEAVVTIRWTTGRRNPQFRAVRRFSSVLR